MEQTKMENYKRILGATVGFGGGIAVFGFSLLVFFEPTSIDEATRNTIRIISELAFYLMALVNIILWRLENKSFSVKKLIIWVVVGIVVAEIILGRFGVFSFLFSW